MRKILVICGPTSTGKTSLAIKLAKKLNGEIVSADSRQVYVGMNIGTGKDIPDNSLWVKSDKKSQTGYYEIQGVKVWGYDLVSPKKEFSVAEYIKIASKIISDISERGKIPILTGGTGLYIRGVIDGIPTAEIPRNFQLRKNLSTKTPDYLFEKLAEMDSAKALLLNSSDRKNPRRLIRSIEIAQFLLNKNRLKRVRSMSDKYKVLFVGLNAPKKAIEKKIRKRVSTRIRQGIEQEIKTLIMQGVGWGDQSMLTLGYRQFRGYFERTIDLSHVLDDWIIEEIRYAKRQMTWFKKDKRIIWFDITKLNFIISIEKLIQKW